MQSKALASQITIDVLGLSRRAYNCLRRVGIDTLDQLVGLSDEQLLAIPRLGDIVLAEIRVKLGAYLADHPLPERPKALHAAQKISVSNETPLYALGLSTATRKLLEQAGIATVGQLVRMPLGQYLSTKRLRRKARKEIEKALKAYLARRPLALLEPRHSLVDPKLLECVATAPLDQIPLERLALPNGLHRQLHHQGVETIGVLVRRPPDALDEPRPIKAQLERYLAWLADQDRDTWAGEVAGRGISPLHQLALAETTLQALVSDWLSCLEERRNQVVRWRYGLNGRRLKLKEVGRELGVSRERARQIQASALNNLARPKNLERIAPFKSLVAHLLAEANGVMNVERLEAALQQHVTVGDINPGAAVRLLAKVDEDLQWLRKVQVCGLSRYPLSAVEGIHKRLARLLAKHPVPLSAQEMLDQFKGTKYYTRLQDELDDAFLLACLRAYPGIKV